MFTRIDHLLIAIDDLTRGIDTFSRLGFNIYPGGVHPGVGTHNAIAFNADEYLELLAVRDRAEFDAAVGRGERPPGLPEFIDQGGGIRLIALQTDDLVGETEAMRQRGAGVGPVIPGSRTTGDGRVLRWLVAYAGPANPLPLFFIQHLTPIEERRPQLPQASNHPNGVQRLERVYVATEDVRADAGAYARLLGVPVPALQRGTVINADMAVFQLGDTGLTVAQPAGPGPAADALARRGPGPFQVVYRTSSLTTATNWIVAHGLPEPVKGTRNTGEQAVLVGPEIACGAYIGFVGPLTAMFCRETSATRVSTTSSRATL